MFIPSWSSTQYKLGVGSWSPVTLGNVNSIRHIYICIINCIDEHLQEKLHYLQINHVILLFTTNSSNRCSNMVKDQDLICIQFLIQFILGETFSFCDVHDNNKVTVSTTVYIEVLLKQCVLCQTCLNCHMSCPDQICLSLSYLD